MVERIHRYFDLVLIHGDQDFIAFDETFPRMSEISDISLYTGYVAVCPGRTTRKARAPAK